MMLAGAAMLLQLSCGGMDPVCPTGNCNLPGSTVVKWQFNHYPEWKFDSDACSDVQAFTVHVDVTEVGNPANIATLEKSCSEGQLTFLGLPPGMYDVSLTPIDVNGAPLTHTVAMGQVLAGTSGANTEVTINVPYTSWNGPYTGTFLFRLSWGGMSCAMAVPPVTTQNLKLTVVGGVTAAMTDMGQRMDGTDDKPCRPLTEQFAQFVEGLPFGPASIVVVGKDAGGVKFTHQFDTFIGASKFNPTFTFDDPPPDAPPDAPPDTM